MMERRNIPDQLSAYLDGELSAAEARRVESAVARDAELARELETLRATRRLVRSLPRAAAPPGLAERIMAGAERMSLMGAAGPSDRRRRAMRWVACATAAAVLVVGVGVGLIVKQTMDAMHRDNPRLARTPDEPQRPQPHRIAPKGGGGGDAARDDGKEGDFRREAKHFAKPAGFALANDEEYRTALALNNATNVNLVVPDVPGNRRAVQREVEHLLATNGLVLVAEEGAERAAKGPRPIAPGSQMRLVAMGTAGQNSKALSAVSGVVTRQNTILAQLPRRPETAGGPKKDRDDEPRTSGRAPAEGKVEGPTPKPKPPAPAAVPESRPAGEAQRSLETAAWAAAAPAEQAKVHAAYKDSSATLKADATLADGTVAATRPARGSAQPADQAGGQAAESTGGLVTGAEWAKHSKEPASRPAQAERDRRRDGLTQATDALAAQSRPVAAPWAASRPGQVRTLSEEELDLVRRVIAGQRTRMQEAVAGIQPLVITVEFRAPEKLGDQVSLEIRPAQDESREGLLQVPENAPAPQSAPADRNSH